MSRYSRQEKLFGAEGQRKLSEATVSVAGCGGLGTYVSLLLASAGVGKMRLVDYGVPSESDLNRQFFYSGRKGFKTDILADRLGEVGPDLEIETFHGFIDKNNISEALGECDVIADCMDTIGSRLVLNSYAVSKNIPLAHGGIDGFYGQATFVVPWKTPCLRCILGESNGRIPDSFAPVVSIVASVQASDIVKHITGTGETTAGKMFTMFAGTNEYDTVAINPDPDCPVCGRSQSSR
ncbi:MAG: ThiF family adenylyltransferase [Candidatus Methanomethylophilaceae archaeon]